ncbi:MAG: tRNA 2-thiouridine(34) synthase MnmA [Ilumatobacteraceae bacterium]|jgi:tRNA-specific 2-thiouridylase
MKVLVAMSGGVDSSVAAAELQAAGHEVVGVTMRLWGGESDTGCCSVSDVDDARRVAQQLGIDHLVFNFSDDFNEHVVAPYVQAHVDGLTPNPCIECNRHLKFDRLSERARLLGFDAVATGHHARIERDDEGVMRLARGADDAKDQSYVVHMLDQAELAYTMFPVGHLTKAQVRERAIELGLRTATKPDSQDVCFISKTGGRETFLGNRIPFRKAVVVNEDGTPAGKIDALELVTIGQRKGLGIPGGGPKQYVVEVDTPNARVVIGEEGSLYRQSVDVDQVIWSDAGDAERLKVTNDVLVQSSAHGAAIPATVEILTPRSLRIHWSEPQRRIAPGQSIVLYNTINSFVLAGGIACPDSAKASLQ